MKLRNSDLPWNLKFDFGYQSFDNRKIDIINFEYNSFKFRSWNLKGTTAVNSALNIKNEGSWAGVLIFSGNSLMIRHNWQ